jgi:hypothetical protein
VTRPRAIELAARIVATAVPALCAVYAIASPTSVLYGGAAWLVVLAASVAGYGHVVERWIGAEVDLGLRMAWGAGLYLGVAGVLLAAGVLSLVPLLVLVAAGLAAYAWRQWQVERPILVAALEATPRAIKEPATTLFFVLVIGVAVVNVAGAVAEQEGNPYDDDVAYTPLVKRLLDTGDLDEPFSFRRISAYGGQTALSALGAARGTLANLYLVDGALFYGIVLLLIAGLARDRERLATVAASRDGPTTDRLMTGFVLLVVVLLPNTSVNTGAYWTGAALFLALYRTVVVTSRDDAPHVRLFVVVGALAAAACTLRQNCISVALLFPLLALLARPRRRDRRLWIATIAAGAAVLLPYWIAAWRSNETFLFPLIEGTFNPDIPTRPTVLSPWQELQFFIKVILEPEPVRVMLVLAPVLLLAQDRRVGRPLTAFTIAVLVGFAMLVHSFTISDQLTLWRYSFAYALPLFVVLVVEGLAPGLRRVTDDDPVPVRIPVVGRIAIIAALLVQIALSGRGLTRKYARLGADLERAAASATHPDRALHLELTYSELQLAAPAGASIAVALDQPYLLDFARNRIFNLDTLGFASPAPGMPFFRGPDAVAAYFQGQGIRYLAFVRGEASRYQYRRETWLRRTFVDTEIFRVQGAYTVDGVDTFAALAATRRVLFERDGMVLVDLGAAR